VKQLEPQSEFWSDFAARYWEQTALAFDLHAPALTNQNEIFAALLKYAERYRAGTVSDVELRWLFDRREEERPHLGTRYDYRNYLADAQDGSLAGYDRRLTSTGVTSYFLQLADYHICDPEIWNRVREFTASLYERTGMPGQKAWCDVVIGRYDCTPFGVHLDGASNFAFGIEGAKTIYLWEPEFYTREMAGADPYDYRRFLGEAVALKIKPGRVVYWPSRYWHVAESDAGFSAVLNLAFYVKGSTSEPLINDLGAQLSARLGEDERTEQFPFDRAHPAEAAREIPASLLHASTTLKSITEGNWTEHALATIWLRKLTGLGYRRAVLPKPYQPLLGHEVIRADPAYPILYLKLSDNTLVCSANGHSLKSVGHPKVIELLERLNSGQAARASDLISAYADGFVHDEESIRGLLETFLTWHAATLETERDDASGAPSR
jgi:hypothetical protein